MAGRFVRDQSNADYIAAANPATVLDLLADRDAMQMERDDLRAEVERLRADVATRDALLRDLNAVAIERGDKFGACDCIDNMGDAYPSQHLTDILTIGRTPKPGRKKHD